MNFHLYYWLPLIIGTESVQEENFVSEWTSKLFKTTMPWSAEKEITLINFYKGEEPFTDKSPFHKKLCCIFELTFVLLSSRKMTCRRL